MALTVFLKTDALVLVPCSSISAVHEKDHIL